MVCGDISGAEAALAQAARRADELGFPHGPYMHVYTCFMESWIRIETGQLDRATALLADVLGQAERHGLDFWHLYGTIQQATIDGLRAVGADPDPRGLATHIATLTTALEILRTMEANAYTTFYDAVLGRLLIGAGQLEQARTRLDTGLQLAQATGMRFYDAELLRLRARTRIDDNARHADIAAALDLARRCGATLFELRAALDDIELRGEPARALLADVFGRMPVDGAWPELDRAQSILSLHAPST